MTGIQDAVRRLIPPEPAQRPFDRPPAPPAPVPKVRGVALSSSAQPSPGNGGAFAESDYTARQYWPERVAAISSDGLFVIMEEPIKSIAMTDGPPATFAEPIDAQEDPEQ